MNPISSRKGGRNKAKPSPILLVAKLDLPVGACKAQSNCVEDEDLNVLSEGPEDQGISSIVWSASHLVSFQDTRARRSLIQARIQPLYGQRIPCVIQS